MRWLARLLRRRPVIAAIGCCRVDKPLGAAGKAGLVRYTPLKAMKYIHSAAEARQMVRIIKGGAMPSPALYRLTSQMLKRSPRRLARARRQFLAADAYVLEISSLRDCTYDGWHLQIYRLFGALAPYITDYRAFSGLFKDTAATLAGLDQAYQADPALGADILRRGRFSQFTADDVRRDVKEIQALLQKPILLVGHFTEGPDGAAIPLRESLRDMLAEMAARDPQLGFYDPTPLVRDYSANAALDGFGHYKKAFEPVMGRALATALDGFLKD